jgi:hypothetical protein
MQTVKTVAELKRALTVGRKIEMVKYNGGVPSEKIRGIGTVTKVQTNGVYIDRGHGNSYLDFPKAANFAPSIEIQGNFEISTPGNYPITLEYRLID